MWEPQLIFSYFNMRLGRTASIHRCPVLALKAASDFLFAGLTDIGASEPSAFFEFVFYRCICVIECRIN
jgi:hypothetical protein